MRKPSSESSGSVLIISIFDNLNSLGGIIFLVVLQFQTNFERKIRYIFILEKKFKNLPRSFLELLSRTKISLLLLYKHVGIFKNTREVRRSTSRRRVLVALLECQQLMHEKQCTRNKQATRLVGYGHFMSSKPE